MRELKFRACRIKPKPRAMWLDVNPHDYRNDSNYALMQYTGLKDKNGVEIYEGDITKNGRFIGEVRFARAQFELVIDEGDKIYTVNPSWNLWPEEQEVIGNIYENPELLK